MSLNTNWADFPQLFLKQTMYFGNQKKTQFTRAIEEYVIEDKAVTSDIPRTDNYVLDGG